MKKDDGKFQVFRKNEAIVYIPIVGQKTNRSW